MTEFRVRHIGDGMLHLYMDGQFRRVFGVFAGDFRDRDEIVSLLNQRYEGMQMRWPVKKDDYKKRFAWFPVKIGDEWVWWEWYESMAYGDHYIVRLPGKNP